MAGFLYYFPGDSVPDPLSLGFPHRREIELPTAPNILAGPDGGPGFMVRIEDAALGVPRAGREAVLPLYEANVQRWEKIAGWWLGWYPAKPCRPEDVQRPRHLRSVPVTLRDGRTWLVPLLLDGELQTCLPFAFVARDGQRKAEVVSEYQTLYARSLEIVPRLSTMSMQEGFELVVDLLACNYVLGEWEILHLGLLGSDSICAAVLAAFDMGEKKTSLSGPGSTPG